MKKIGEKYELTNVTKKVLSQMSEDLPDPDITQTDMKAYGYEFEGMLPLKKEAARRLAEEADVTIYMLYNDNTESMVMDLAEINDFDGIFGIERQDWEKIKVRDNIRVGENTDVWSDEEVSCPAPEFDEEGLEM